jgi:hypothetical protein
MVLMFAADVMPVPVQLKETGVAAVLALTFTEVSVQFNTADTEAVVAGTVVFCVTACEPVAWQPLAVFVTV